MFTDNEKSKINPIYKCWRNQPIFCLSRATTTNQVVRAQNSRDDIKPFLKEVSLFAFSISGS